jgi:hypothetical protein
MDLIGRRFKNPNKTPKNHPLGLKKKKRGFANSDINSTVMIIAGIVRITADRSESEHSPWRYHSNHRNSGYIIFSA